MSLKKITALFIMVILICTAFPMVYAEGFESIEHIPMTSFDETNDSEGNVKKTGCVAMQRKLTSYICFKDVIFEDEPYAVVISSAISSEYMKDNKFEIRLDSPTGEIISTVYVTECITWHNPLESEGTVDKKISGVHDVYISTNQPNDAYYFYFKASNKGKFVYKPYEQTNIYEDINNSIYRSEIEEMSDLGFVDAFEENKYSPDFPVTRIQFAKWASKLITDQAQETTEQIFSDVPLGTDGVNEVNCLYENSIITLNEAGTFSPYNFITVRDATVMMLRILGYEFLCQEKGGYPTGYSMYASECKLLKDVAPNEHLRRSTAAKLLYDTINAEYIDIILDSVNSYKYEKKKYILEKTRNIYKGKDRVKATLFGSVAGEIHISDKNCYIGTEQYNIGECEVTNYLGVLCDYYYLYDIDTDDKTLIYIKPARKVKEIFIKTGIDVEITEISPTLISYVDGNGKEVKHKIKSNATWIYNNKAMTRAVSTIAPTTFRGSIRLVDNGEGIDTVHVETYRNIKIASVDGDTLILVDGLTREKINLSEYELYISDGKESLKLKNLKVGSLCELYISDDNEMAIIMVGGSSFDGVAKSKIENSRVVIDSKEYVFANEFNSDFALGIKYTFYLNLHDEIVYCVSNDTSNKLGVYNGVRIEDDYSDEAYVEIHNQENELKRYRFAPTVYIDGIRCKEVSDISARMTNVGLFTPVCYTLNENNEIRLLDTVLDGAKNDKDQLSEYTEYTGKEFRYKVNLKTFTEKSKLRTIRPLSNDATFISLDKDGVGIDSCDISKFTSVGASAIMKYKFYSLSRNMNKTDIVYCDTYTKQRGKNCYIVDSKVYTVNDKDELGVEIIYVKGSNVKSHWISQENSDYSDALLLSKGDVICAYEAANGDLEGFDLYLKKDLSESLGTKDACLSASANYYGDVNFDTTAVLGTVRSVDVDGNIEVLIGNEEENPNENKIIWVTPSSATTFMHTKRDEVRTSVSSAEFNKGDRIFVNFITGKLSMVYVLEK